MLKDLCFEIIQTCPNHCKFCSSNSSRDATTIITLEDFKKTIEHFQNNGGVEEVSLSGGEPFLHPDLFEMVRYCKEAGIRTVIFTSGIQRREPITEAEKEWIEKQRKNSLQEIELHESWNERLKGNVNRYYERMLTPPEFGPIPRQDLERLQELGLDKIVLDYQAYEEETDQELMGRRGLHTYLIDSLIAARLSGLNVDVHFIPMKPNYRQFPDLLECLEIAKVQGISLLNFVPQGRGRVNREELMLSEAELREFARILEGARPNFSGRIRIGIPLLGNVKHLCTAGTEKLDIRYDGTILPCPAFKEISMETMEKYGIYLWSIYEDLDKVVVPGGKRERPLCQQVYGFCNSIVKRNTTEQVEIPEER